MTFDYDNSIVRLIDKTNPVPTGITEGGLIDGNLLTPEIAARITDKEGEPGEPPQVNTKPRLIRLYSNEGELSLEIKP